MQKSWALFLVMYVVRKIARRAITSGASQIAQWSQTIRRRRIALRRKVPKTGAFLRRKCLTKQGGYCIIQKL